MNRPIKFRAWDKKERKWAKIKEWSESGINATIYDGRSIPNLELHSDDYYEWSQFTGLKDKNGKEVYEGDLLQLSPELHKDYNDTIFSVSWDDEQCAWNIIKPLGDYVVIGNIYENPTLHT